MQLQPLLQAPAIIQLHTYAALAALVLAAIQLVLPKGTGLHRVLGYAWALLMMAIALSSLAIHTIRLWGPFSPIHILSVVTLVGVPAAVMAARRGDIARHKRGMLTLIILALLGAGTFAALVPGRILHSVLFGG